MLEGDSLGMHRGGKAILTAASLTTRAGQITLLVGRNGAGKSSLLRALVGVERPLHGIVRFRGEIQQPPTLWRMARLGLFWLPDAPILDPFVDLGRQLDGMARRWRQEGARDPREVAEVLDLGPFLGTAPARLSGGELRRAEIAFALVRRSACLVMDEPFRGVAPRDAEHLAALCRTLADEGTAVLLTGHELPVLRALADAVVWCTAGTTHQYLDPAAAWTNHDLQRDFLGPITGAGRPWHK